jgi:SAM-dependent methyltransferase
MPSISEPEIAYEHWHRYLYAAELAAGKTVLDIASGEGYGSHLLAQKAKWVVGVDVDAEAVRHASGKYFGSNLEFRCGSTDAIPLEGSHLVDMVVSFETIEHIWAEQQVRFLSEVKRLLTPEGVLVLSTPNKLTYSDLPGYKNPFHRTELYYDDYVGLLRKFFRNLHLLGQKAYPTSYMWQLNGASQSFLEYQLAYSAGQFGQIHGDRKEVLYMVAICSDGDIEVRGGSILLDISEQATRGRLQKLQEMNLAVQTISASLAAKEQAVQAITGKESETYQRGMAIVRQTIEEHVQTLSRLQESAQRDVAELQRRLAEVAGEKEAAHGEIAGLHGRIAEVAREKEAAQGEIASLQHRIQDLTDAREANQREVSDLRQLVREQKAQISTLTARIDSMSEREEELREILLDAQEQLLRRDDEIQTTLAGTLSRYPSRDSDSMALHKGYVASDRIAYWVLIQKIREVVRGKLPPEATVLVVSKGDEDLLQLEGRRGWHFPQQEDGIYAGYYPADSATAIAHLEALRAKGADFLLFPSTALWWLDQYPEFRQHLESRYCVAARQDDRCVIFDLRQAALDTQQQQAVENASPRAIEREPCQAVEPEQNRAEINQRTAARSAEHRNADRDFMKKR